MYTWTTKFKPGDKVSAVNRIGIVDTLHVGTFLNHNLDVDPETTSGMRENSIGHYAVTYGVSFGEDFKYVSEYDLSAKVDI